MCIVDLRLPAQFPTAPVLLLVHDLLSGTSNPLETLASPAFFVPGWSAERMARECFLQLCEDIVSVAFGGADQDSKAPY